MLLSCHDLLYYRGGFGRISEYQGGGFRAILIRLQVFTCVLILELSQDRGLSGAYLIIR